MRKKGIDSKKQKDKFTNLPKNTKAAAAKKSYFQERMDLLGITPEINKMKVIIFDPEKRENILIEKPIFEEVEQGIRINVFDLNRDMVKYRNAKVINLENGWDKITSGSKWLKDFFLTRLKEPYIKGGDTIKYLIPKGAGTHPFFPPGLVDKYEQGKEIHTLYLVEGYFKAFKAWMHGVDIIGLSSITHMKDKETGGLHSDIIRVMQKCKVQRLVWLTDGDALDITQKEITEGIDLYKRPNGFFQSVNTFHTLVADYPDLQKWFMHIDTEAIFRDNKTITRENLKGIDDLLISFPTKTAEIIKDLQSVSSNGYYFQKFNISFGLGKVHQHFHLTNVKDFYIHHSERRPELKNKEFIFHGTRYLYNEETGDCDIKIPKDAKNFIRVGDSYYENFPKPNQFNETENTLDLRLKATIVDDYGKGFLKHIPKYKSFINVPNHVSYQQVIEHCYNVYCKMDYEPLDEECTADDCPNIIDFITHLFGENTVSFTDKETQQEKKYLTLELALDYLQLLYKNPQQKLPILCLVSKENNTGKSTLAYFLRLVFGGNVAIVGNADLAGDFNAHWATKNIVICDETKIDKQHVVEKIKSLSTANKIYMNAKGRGQVELDCFMKFILITNNEETFIYASEEDIRYWVIKVPVLKKEDPTIIGKLKQEIPAFLSLLNKRKLATEHKNRMWFHPDLLKTEALSKLVERTKPTAEKQIRHYIREMFFSTGLDEILMSTADIIREVFNGNSKYDADYINGIIKSNMKIEKYHEWQVKGIKEKNEFKSEDEAIKVAELNNIPKNEVSKIYKITRYTYQKNVETFNEQSEKVFKLVTVKIEKPGRPFVFKKEKFLATDEFVQDDQNTQVSGDAEELPFPIVQNFN